ncbi:MAG TPA: hypothetical protein VFS17_06820 [Methylophilaceae bacterium]|nr:hypothetical protein [Methylophilaceae bacterium]
MALHTELTIYRDAYELLSTVTRLIKDMPMSQADIKAGLQALQLTRLAFRNNNRSTIAKLARDAQIAILAAENKGGV